MKKLMLVLLSASTVLLTACSGTPKECDAVITKIESEGAKIGLTQEQLDSGIKRMKEDIKNMKTDDAINMCKQQASLLGLNLNK